MVMSYHIIQDGHMVSVPWKEWHDWMSVKENYYLRGHDERDDNGKIIFSCVLVFLGIARPGSNYFVICLRCDGEDFKYYTSDLASGNRVFDSTVEIGKLCMTLGSEFLLKIKRDRMIGRRSNG